MIIRRNALVRQRQQQQRSSVIHLDSRCRMVAPVVFAVAVSLLLVQELQWSSCVVTSSPSNIMWLAPTTTATAAFVTVTTPTTTVVVPKRDRYFTNRNRNRNIRPILMSSTNDETPAATSTGTTGRSSTPTTTQSNPVGKMIQQTVLIDGPEWHSVQNQFVRRRRRRQSQQSEQKLPMYMSTGSTSGIYTVVTGSVNGQRMVGMQSIVNVVDAEDDDAVTVVPLDQDPNIQMDMESIAYLPIQISEMDAIWTMIQSISTIHCCRPVIHTTTTNTTTTTAASSDSSIDSDTTGRIVIIGNNPLSIQIATILHDVFQYNVTMVATTTTTPTTALLPESKKKSSSGATDRGIQYIPPSIERFIDNDDDDDDVETTLLGFANIVNQFDVLIDTIGNESSNRIVLQNLKTNHNCDIYHSIISESQQIILQNGLLFGPNQCKEHIQQLITASSTTTTMNTNNSNKKNNKNQPTYFPSPFGLGKTVEMILQEGIVWKQPSEANSNNNKNKNIYVRGWSMKDFWEYTTWPRDATTSNTRFGFPSDIMDENNNNNKYGSDFDIDDDDDDDDDDTKMMISAPPLRSSPPGRNMFRTKPENFMDDDDDDNDMDDGTNANIERTKTTNRYVIDASTVTDLQQIVSNELSCIVFVSAPFCRTCRYLKPQYTRMARQYTLNHGNNNDDNNNNTDDDDTIPTLNGLPTLTDDAATTESVTMNSKKSTRFLFIKAEASGQMGKDIGRALGIDTVPTFILYKNGRRYGTPITSVSRLPSKALDDTIDAIQLNRTLDFTSLFPPDKSSMDSDDDDNENSSNNNRRSTNRSKLS